MCTAERNVRIRQIANANPAASTRPSVVSSRRFTVRETGDAVGSNLPARQERRGMREGLLAGAMFADLRSFANTQSPAAWCSNQPSAVSFGMNDDDILTSSRVNRKPSWADY